MDNRLEVKGGSPTKNSDHWLRDQVNFVLMFHRSVEAATTEIDVEYGVATLRGGAASNAQIQLTTEYAMDVEGVTDVNNDTTVNTSQLPPKVDKKVDDASISSQVKMTMRYHRSTNSLLTKIKTKQGVETLYGKGSDIAELDQATKLVSDVYCVKCVINRMPIE
jgi:osmotically-inducible protein OsmY